MQTFSSGTNRLTNILYDVIQHKPKVSHAGPRQHQLKKHHWVLGTFVVLAGSWITHTTTATISDNLSLDQTLDYARLLDENYLSDIPEKVTDLSEITNQPLGLFAVPEKLSLPLKKVTHVVKRGETLGQIFKKLDLDLAIPHNISQHDSAKQLVSLSIGQSLTFKLDDSDQLKEISYPNNQLQELSVKLENNEVKHVDIVDIPFDTVQRKVSGEITSSLYDAALDAGLSINLTMEMVRIFGWDIDFVQDIRKGDAFHVIYEDHQFDGQKLADGNIIAAEFTTQGNTYRTIRFEDSDGAVSYYTPEGESMLGTFLRSPVEFSRISSRFGNRKHPILKTWRAHKGVDYAASSGTPIRATANGKVIQVGTNGGYGKTVTLRHAGRFTTLYAHMTRYADGISNGATVQQGDIIGYVGSTGLATGPHLHYEFRVDGVHQNPLTYKTPKASSISDADKIEFANFSQQYIAQLDSVIKDYQLAKADTGLPVNAEL